MKPNCDCGKYHQPLTDPKVGDRVRVRVHWRLRHACGTITAVRDGWFDKGVVVCDVALDTNHTGLTDLRAMLPSELWKES